MKNKDQKHYVQNIHPYLESLHIETSLENCDVLISFMTPPSCDCGHVHGFVSTRTKKGEITLINQYSLAKYESFGSFLSLAMALTKEYGLHQEIASAIEHRKKEFDLVESES